MERNRTDDSHPDPVQFAVQSAILVCHQTTAGSWICCSDDGAPRCARGLTLAGAAANWERAQDLAE